MTKQGNSWLERNFYVVMTTLIVIIVIAGFSRTIDRSLIHPQVKPPTILYAHALLCTVWLLVLLAQTLLVRIGMRRWHQWLGWCGLVAGLSLPFITLITKRAILHTFGAPDKELAFVAITLNDMLSFGVTFVLAMYWRKRPSHHRRLIMLAACSLTVAALARLHSPLIVAPWWYLYVDGLIALDIIRERANHGSIHVVYRIGLPLMMVGQAMAMYLFLTAPEVWVTAVRWFMGVA